MALLENNLLDVIHDCIEGKDLDLQFSDKKAICLVMCSGWLSGNFEIGYEIQGLDKGKTQQCSLCWSRANCRKSSHQFW